jgi:hypothetical protein
MASELSLSLIIGASAGAAFATFGNLKGVMQRVSDATKDLKARQGELGKTIKASANLPQPDLDRLNAQYKKQEQLLGKLRESTKALGRTQAAIAANEAARAHLRGKMVETAALAYVAAKPVQIAASFEDKMKDIAITGGFSKEEEASMGAAVRAAALEWNQTQEEIAKGLGVLTAGGIDNAKALERYAPIMAKAATASRASMEDLGALSITFNKTLGLDEKESLEALNMAAYAGKRGQFELADMAKVIPELAPALKDLGVTGKAAVSEMAASLQIARMGAGSNAEAATNYANFLQKITAKDSKRWKCSRR